MAYKKTSPALQDSIEVFLDQVQVIEKVSEALNTRSQEITETLRKVGSSKVPIDTSNLDSKIQIFKSSVDNLQSELSSKKTEFQKIFKRSEKHSLYTFITILVCLLVSVIAIYFSIKANSEKNELSQSLDSHKSFNVELATFIKEKGLENEFIKFQDQKKKN